MSGILHSWPFEIDFNRAQIRSRIKETDILDLKSEASYIVFTDGSKYYAKNGSTGMIEYSDTDASNLLQNVIYALYNNYDGGTVFIKRGTYVLTKPINITYDAPIMLVGETPFKQTMTSEQGVTYLKYIGPSGTSDNPISVINADSGQFLRQQYILLKDLVLGLVGKAYPYTRAVNLNRVNKFWIERVYVYADGLYNPATENYGFFTNVQGDNGGVMIDTFSASFYSAYKFTLDHFVGIRMQALYSRFGFWLHYAGSEILLINPHAYSCLEKSFYINLSYGGSATLIEPYSEGSPTYDYDISGSNQYVTIINPRAGRSPPVVNFFSVDFSKIAIVGGTIKLRNSGVATIPAGSTKVTVNHGLATTPTKFQITPLGQPPGKLWVENITSTSFDIVTDTAPGSNLNVSWYAEV